MIEITGLKKSFGTNAVLKGVDITIEPGETVAVIGASGSGKSVLLKSIIGLLPPDEGTITVGGLSIPGATETELQAVRSTIGFLFQGAALFDSMSVEENITLGLRDHEARGIMVRTVANGHELRKHTEREYAELVREKLALVDVPGVEKKKPAALSGGQKKRVGLARALAMDPAYMFYDEPTTGLDPAASTNIDNLIASLTDRLNVTSVIVTHDMFTVYRIAKRVIFLFEGRIYFDGTPEGLKRSEDPSVQRFLARYNEGANG